MLDHTFGALRSGGQLVVLDRGLRRSTMRAVKSRCSNTKSPLRATRRSVGWSCLVANRCLQTLTRLELAVVWHFKIGAERLSEAFEVEALLSDQHYISAKKSSRHSPIAVLLPARSGGFIRRLKLNLFRYGQKATLFFNEAT
jgi:hypothetical protein